MPPRWYRATCIGNFSMGARPYRSGDAITLVDVDKEELRAAGLIADIHEIPRPVVETATVDAPEDASRNYRRRGR